MEVTLEQGLEGFEGLSHAEKSVLECVKASTMAQKPEKTHVLEKDSGAQGGRNRADKKV